VQEKREELENVIDEDEACKCAIRELVLESKQKYLKLTLQLILLRPAGASAGDESGDGLFISIVVSCFPSLTERDEEEVLYDANDSSEDDDLSLL
jgi:hypothetical protein